MVQETQAQLSGVDLLNAMIEQNVLAQLENLRTHPAVSARLAQGKLNLNGWVYDIECGAVRVLDPLQARFVPLQARTPALS